jgi:hypothetical protein
MRLVDQKIKDPIEEDQPENRNEEHTTVDVMRIREGAKVETKAEVRAEVRTEADAKVETKDEFSCYFFEEDTENTCFICADLPPGENFLS